MSWLNPNNFTNTSLERANGMDWDDLEALRLRDPDFADYLEDYYGGVIALNHLVRRGNFETREEAQAYLDEQDKLSAPGDSLEDLAGWLGGTVEDARAFLDSVENPPEAG